MNKSTLTVCVGDIFASHAQTLVNTVNCAGVMGAGIALEFKRRFPEMYKDYKERCEQSTVKLGQPYPYRNQPQQQALFLDDSSQQDDVHPSIILNFPTKNHWKQNSTSEDIEKGLQYLKTHYKQWRITSLAMPALGCGNGGLTWHDVGPRLYRHLSRLNIPIVLYAPHGTPAHELKKSFLAQPKPEKSARLAPEPSTIYPALVVLATILAQRKRKHPEEIVNKGMLGKIAAVAKGMGLPAGPKTSLMERLERHGLIEEQRMGRQISVRPGPTYPEAAKACQQELRQWEILIREITSIRHWC